MTWQSGGGGGGGASYPGVTADGLTPGGIVVAGALQAGDNVAVGTPTFNRIDGVVTIQGHQANLDDFDSPLFVGMGGTLSGDEPLEGVILSRAGVNLNGFQFTRAAVVSDDAAGSTADIHVFSQNLTAKARIGHAGGLGLFGHTAPDTAASITGALSAVADPAAQAVLTAVIAALTADGGATDDTT